MVVAKEARWEPDVRDLTTKQTNKRGNNKTNERGKNKTNKRYDCCRNPELKKEEGAIKDGIEEPLLQIIMKYIL